MRTGGFVSKKRWFSSLAVLSLSFSTLVYSAESAGACSLAPNAPSVKTIWGPTGAPTFEVTPAKTGDAPRNLSYTYTTLDREIGTWSAWSKWEDVNTSAGSKSVIFTPKVGFGDDAITFSAIAQNYCGNSPQELVKRTLAPSSEWAPNGLNIAEDLPLSLGTVPFDSLFKFRGDVPFSVVPTTPNICSNDTQTVSLLAAGECRLDISFNNSAMQSPVSNLSVAFNILPRPKVLPAVAEDRPDEINGFQFHVVYVEVKGFESKNYDVSGDINNWLDLTNTWLKRKIGKEFVFDTYQGAYDISKLKSQYTSEELNFDKGYSSINKPLEKLSAEFASQNTRSLLGKNLLFITDAPIANNYCGLANRPGSNAIALTKGNCWSPEDGYLGKDVKFNNVSDTIAHELIHNLGVEHTCEDPNDLMVGEGCDEALSLKEKGEKALDSANAHYVRANKSGVDILEVKVWRDGSGKRYIPVTGACFVGEPCLVSNATWTRIAAPLQIQEFINGKWKTIGTFKGKKSGSKTFIEASIVATSKGVHRYREFVPATKSVSAYIGKPILRTVLY